MLDILLLSLSVGKFRSGQTRRGSLSGSWLQPGGLRPTVESGKNWRSSSCPAGHSACWNFGSPADALRHHRPGVKIFRNQAEFSARRRMDG
jgi:hypothetical protein